jgi:predicted amidohydrolase YtcJ
VDRPPVRIEHAQLVHPADLPRFGALGVVASVQPVHCLSDMPWMTDRVGASRLRGAYAWGSLAAGGAVLAAGSDVPVESADPRPGLFALAARGDRGSGTPESLDREAALAAFTRGAARTSGDGGGPGTLAPGTRADLVVFDRNLVTCKPEALLEARPWLTMVAGKPVWVDPESPIASSFAGISP